MKLTAYTYQRQDAALSAGFSRSGLCFGTANGSNHAPAAYPNSPQLTSFSRIRVSEEEVGSTSSLSFDTKKGSAREADLHIDNFGSISYALVAQLDQSASLRNWSLEVRILSSALQKKM